MWFLTNFEGNPEILRGSTMQFQPSLGKLLTGFQLLTTEKTRICFVIVSHFQLAIPTGVSGPQLTSLSLCPAMSSNMMDIPCF